MPEIKNKSISRKTQLLLGISVCSFSVAFSAKASYAQQCPGQQHRQIECHDHKGQPIDITICEELATRGIMIAKPEDRLDCTYYCGDGGDGSDGGGGGGSDCGCGSPDSPSPGCPGPDGGGGGDGGGKVLCGFYHAQGLLPDNIYKGDLEFADHSVDETTKRGYLLWAVPLVEHLYKNPNGLMFKLVQPFVIGWATEMAYRTGYHYKGSWIGKLELMIISPIVKLVGLFAKETSFAHLTHYKDLNDGEYMFDGDMTAIVNV